MTTIELTNKAGQKWLYQLDTGWEIYDKGADPAWWVNNREGRNLDAVETYAEVKAQLFQNSGGKDSVLGEHCK